MTGAGRRCSLDVLWDERYAAYDFGPTHPFSQNSRRLGVRLLEELGFFDATGAKPPRRVQEVPVASDEELFRFHDRPYVEFVRQKARSHRPSFLDAGDTPAFPGCHEAAARVVGGTLVGLRSVLAGEVDHAFNPAGGLHHAAPAKASGFCIYDDVALALRTALGPGGLRRVAYVDLDAHHGDGVMYGTYDDGRVLDIDFHQDGRTLFPGTGFPTETGTGDGAGLKVNVPLPPAAGDEAVVPLFQRIVPPLLREFRPELIVLQTGVDAHVGDPLAHLQYTPAAYATMVGTLHDLSHELGHGRLVETGGGGYLPGNVSRVLARAAGILAGRPFDPASPSPLPEGWRREFQETSGDEAPRRWTDVPPGYATPWTSDKEEKLVGELERSLGRKFPGRHGSRGTG